jgi:hypothetical protein
MLVQAYNLNYGIHQQVLGIFIFACELAYFLSKSTLTLGIIIPLVSVILVFVHYEVNALEYSP